MATDDRIDGRMRELVQKAMAEAVPEDETARDRLTETVLAHLQPAFGAKAQRRRLISELRAAYKEGFLTGRNAGRFSRWHSEIWNRSALAMKLRNPSKADADAQERYARYNLD
jgi:hypothetical protein